MEPLKKGKLLDIIKKHYTIWRTQTKKYLEIEFKLQEKKDKNTGMKWGSSHKIQNSAKKNKK